MDRTGNAYRAYDLLTDTDCSRHGGNTRLSLFDRSGPASLLRLIQGS